MSEDWELRITNRSDEWGVTYDIDVHDPDGDFQARFSSARKNRAISTAKHYIRQVTHPEIIKFNPNDEFDAADITLQEVAND